MRRYPRLVFSSQLAPARANTSIRACSTLSGPISKVLAANRGEIAIRILRAATELDKQSAGVFSKEDRSSAHRYKADESYEIIGEGLSPVGAYLAQDNIIKIAKNCGADAIHPGYGFLSENAEFADACKEAGIRFVGPPGDVLRKFGSKTEARALAIAAGVPVVPGSDGPVKNVEDAKAFAAEAGLPIIIKAAFGGGGRGMRIVKTMEEVEEGFLRAQSEARAAFGNDTVFMEKFVEQPRHIEVQVIADHTGDVVHLYERDCSVQRRHQKVVESAPALSLDPELRQQMLDDAVKLAKEVNYVNAGTVEFLVDTDTGKYYFMEVNPRVQVEHTVTEEVTGIDIVQTQISIAEGATLKELGLVQDKIKTSGYAIQCRITTEDPTAGFRPDTGVITVYRSGTGPGIRLDDGPGYPGANITPHYDSLLVKVTARDATFGGAIATLKRSLAEHRIRGVTTNIPFLRNVLEHPLFLSGNFTTRFLEENEELVTNVAVSADRGTKLLRYLAEVSVNGHPPALGADPGALPADLDPRLPAIEVTEARKEERLGRMEAGEKTLRSHYTDANNTFRDAKAFAKAVRGHKGTLITDTTWRDAHQSLLATRVRTTDLLQVAPATAEILAGAYSLENWGGATFDVAMRFLHECPWERLVQMREAVPDIPFQMLLRGANGVGYTSYPDNAIYKFCDVAVRSGMDVFRVFDSLNYMDNMRLGMDAVNEAGGIVEAAICYTGDVSDSSRAKYNLDYYMNFAQQLVEHGTHVLCVKDMAGLLKPEAATILIGELRREFPEIPIHVHTHDTPGTGVASMIAATRAGADAVDSAIDSMSGTTSQPSMGALVAALAGTEYDTGLDLRKLNELNTYWEQCRGLYRPFEQGQMTGSADTYLHEMPGGQYTNLMFQSKQLGLSSQWPDIKQAYAEANQILGDIVKVTPSSKVVGDLAQFMVSNGLNRQQVEAQASTLSFPGSVVEYLQGYLGVPHGGFPEPFRTNVLKDRTLPDGSKSFVDRPGAQLPPADLEEIRGMLKRNYGLSDDQSLMSYIMYPAVFEEWQDYKAQYGKVDMIPTREFLSRMQPGEQIQIDVAPGKTLYIVMKSHGLPDESGMCDVEFNLNGENRVVRVLDKSFKASANSTARGKANKDDISQVPAPMMGVVLDVRVKEGDVVEAGTPLVVMSAMKMETVVAAPMAGKVSKLTVKANDAVDAGDLIVEIDA